MKKIEIGVWIEEYVDGQGKPQKKSANTITLLGYLVNNANPMKAPKGLDHFRAMNRIGKAFDKAEEEIKKQSPAFLDLEEADYIFLKRLVQEEIPARFGKMPGIVDAVEKFLNPTE